MNYTVEFLTVVEREDIPRLDRVVLTNVQKAISAKLLKSPTVFGKPLRESLKGHRSLRVEDYRIVYTVEQNSNILVVAIRHRRDVYKIAEKRI
ncbi:MAG: type II toxin-antitoxin system mRNA interferase toxin, RelE/StbE family [Patescibacteria group bacterium]